MSEPHRLHPAAIVLMAIRIGREMFVPAIIPIIIQFFRHGLDALNARTLLLVVLGVLIFLAVSVTYGVLAWRRYTYRIEMGELRVEQGVISQKRRYIPLERIQAVDLSQGILQRLLGVVSVRVETAGGDQSRPEVSLAAVARSDARLLSQALAGHPEQAETRQETAAALPTRRLSIGDLVLAGSTSGRVGVAISIVASVLAFANNAIPFDEITGQFDRFSVLVTLFLAGAIFVGFVWLLGLFGTILAHAGFTLTRNGDNLSIERGLLERRQATIPVDRIQTIRIVEGMLRQPFGLVEVRIESAGYGDNSGESTVLFPLLRRSEVLPFLQEMTPSLAVLAEFNPLPARSRRRYVFHIDHLAPAIVLAAALSILLYPLGLVSLLLIPAALLLGLWQFRDAGWVIAGDTLLLRWRALARTTVIMPRRRIQMGETRRSPFQRRAALGTFAARVASGGSGAAFDLRHMDEDDVRMLMNWLAPTNRHDVGSS